MPNTDFSNRLVRGTPLIPRVVHENLLRKISVRYYGRNFLNGRNKSALENFGVINKKRRNSYSKKDKTVRVYLSDKRTREKFNRRKNSKERAYDARIYFTLYHG